MPARGATLPESGFTGFGPRALAFFEALAFHQTKEWFEENRALYETEVKAPLTALVADLSEELARRGVPLRADPKKNVFRIHRDVRFSKDKSPYKTHAGATLTRDGGKLTQGLLYLHIGPPKLDPSAPFLAAGFYAPEPDELLALRTRIVERPADWAKVARALESRGIALSTDEKLARMPKGFEAAPAEFADVLKLKNLTVSRTIPAEAIFEPALVSRIADFAEEAVPLLSFGWRALEALPPRRP